MDKLQRIEEMERQLAALKAEVEQETKPKQWDPEGGCFLVVGNGAIYNMTGAAINPEFGGTYKTREAAEKAAAAMRTHNRLLAYVAEFAPDYEFMFGISNYCVVYDKLGGFGVHCHRDTKVVGAVYMRQQVAENLCRKLNSGEVVL